MSAAFLVPEQSVATLSVVFRDFETFHKVEASRKTSQTLVGDVCLYFPSSQLIY